MIPGFSSKDVAWLNYEARRVVEAALALGIHPSRLVLRVSPEGATAELRSELADEYDRNDVRALARQVRSTVTPPGVILVLVDAECTHLTTVRLSVLLSDAPAAPARISITP